ncbi:MAG: histidine kinase dimerization/phospho-acceptor domain-containing protein [Thermoleophilaceae bacterium]
MTSTIRRPLSNLVEATRRLAAGDLAQRVDPGGPRELVQLDGAFNEMAEGLEEAQARLEAERVKLAVTVDSLGDALVVTDGEGVVTAANPRAAELVPMLPVGAGAHARASPLPEVDRGLAGDVAAEVQGRSLSITAGRLPDLGEGGGVAWTIRDVSERARLERMKTDFVATASHELRSPLTSIKGFVELLERSDALGPREREFVDVVLQSTDRLVELVNDLLDVARLEAGRMEIHPRLFDVGEVIQEVSRLLGPRVGDKEQKLFLDLPPGLPKVLADPVRVRQIMTNLISNAHLYSDVGSQITVTADAHRDEVELAVADDGRGMTQEDMDSVFDRFVRRNDALGGTGLGLSIVRSLAELQGGPWRWPARWVRARSSPCAFPPRDRGPRPPGGPWPDGACSWPRRGRTSAATCLSDSRAGGRRGPSWTGPVSRSSVCARSATTRWCSTSRASGPRASSCWTGCGPIRCWNGARWLRSARESRMIAWPVSGACAPTPTPTSSPAPWGPRCWPSGRAFSWWDGHPCAGAWSPSCCAWAWTTSG